MDCSGSSCDDTDTHVERSGPEKFRTLRRSDKLVLRTSRQEDGNCCSSGDQDSDTIILAPNSPLNFRHPRLVLKRQMHHPSSASQERSLAECLTSEGLSTSRTSPGRSYAEVLVSSPVSSESLMDMLDSGSKGGDGSTAKMKDSEAMIAVTGSVDQVTLEKEKEVANTNLLNEHNQGNKPPAELLTTSSQGEEPLGHIFDTLFCHESRKDPNNTLISTSSPDTTADSLAMSVPVDVNYPPTDSETLKSRKHHELLLEEVRKSVEEYGEHLDVFSSPYTTTDDSSNFSSSGPMKSSLLLTAGLDSTKIKEVHEVTEKSSHLLAGDTVHPLTDDDPGDEDELTSGGEEDIMAQFGSGKKKAGFVNALDERTEGSGDSRDEKAKLVSTKAEILTNEDSSIEKHMRHLQSVIHKAAGSGSLKELELVSLLSEINIDSLKVWKAHSKALAKISATDKHTKNDEKLREEEDADEEIESEDEDMNESMDYIPHTAILHKVSGHPTSNDEVAILPTDDRGGYATQSDTSPVAHRPTLPKRESNKQRRFPSYLKSRTKFSVDGLESRSPLARSEQDICSKIDGLQKLLEERTYQKAESDAHYQQILEGMGKQLENQGGGIARLCQTVEHQLRINTTTTRHDKAGNDTAKTVNVGDIEKVLGGVTDLQTNLNIIKALISSEKATNNEIVTLTEANDKLAENNIDLRQMVTALFEDNEASQSNQKMAFMRGFKLGRLQLDRQELGPLDQLSYDSLNTDGGEVLWPQGDEPMLLGSGLCKCGEPIGKEFPGATMGWFRWLIHALFYLGAFYYLTLVIPFHMVHNYLYLPIRSALYNILSESDL